jgi:DNA-binding transcriptional MerR regulator
MQNNDRQNKIGIQESNSSSDNHQGQRQSHSIPKTDDESEDEENKEIRISAFDLISSQQDEGSTSLVMRGEQSNKQGIVEFLAADSVALRSSSVRTLSREVAFNVSRSDTFETTDNAVTTVQQDTATSSAQFGTAQVVVNSVRPVSHTRIKSVTEQSKTVQSIQEMSQSNASEEFEEIEIEGEFFEWTGGQPFGQNRPVFIIHKASGEGQSLTLLKRLLRDEYSAIVGGEPTATQVEFIANEPRFPQIPNHIVTLDLAGDEWDATISDDTPKIEGYNRDIVPDLVSQISEGFSGNLGFFILNAPSEWSIPLIQDRFYERLRTHLLQDVKNESVARCVVLAKDLARNKSPSELARQYFSAGSDGMSVGEIESVYERALSKPHWVRTRFTKFSAGRDDDGESREHYLLKSAVVEAVIRQAVGVEVWSDTEKLHASVNRLHEDNGVQIQTEKQDADRIPDVSVTVRPANNEYANRVSKFLLSDTSEEERGQTHSNDEARIAVEVETGRSQAGFNLRKIRETLEKYDQNQDDAVTFGAILLVVHPRLTRLDKDRRRHLKQIVGEWRETNETEVQLATPDFRTTPDGKFHRLKFDRISVGNWKSGQND